MKIQEIQGDLFTSKDSLAHCVSRDFYMGKGIAVSFKDLFGNVRELQAQNKKIGQVAILKDEPQPSSRFIFYLITKDRYFQKPTYDSLRACLKDLAVLCTELKIKHLAMPRIGCGLDRLDWKRVKECIIDAFKDTEIHITVYFVS